MKRRFLAGTRMQYLVRAHERETGPGAKMRLLAAMHHKEGRSIREIAGMPKVPRTTVNGWLDRMDRTGLRGRYRTRHGGGRAQAGPGPAQAAGPGPARGAAGVRVGRGGVDAGAGEEARQEEVRGGLRPELRLAPPQEAEVLMHHPPPAQQEGARPGGARGVQKKSSQDRGVVRRRGVRHPVPG